MIKTVTLAMEFVDRGSALLNKINGKPAVVEDVYYENGVGMYMITTEFGETIITEDELSKYWYLVNEEQLISFGIENTQYYFGK